MYYGYYYDFNWTTVALIIAVIFSLWASVMVKSTFKKYSKVRAMSGMTGAQAAQRVLERNGVTGVRIEHIAGNLTDHYDPRSNVIRLSDSVYNTATPAAIGVAAHEAGHAVQYSRNYAPIKLRNAIIPATNFGSKLAIPLIFIGLIFQSAGSFMIMLAYIGIILFSLTVLFQLFTLPTEFDASRRAVKTLEGSGILDSQELTAVRKVLTAAAMTYVAALAVAITNLLRLLSIVGRRN